MSEFVPDLPRKLWQT